MSTQKITQADHEKAGKAWMNKWQWNWIWLWCREWDFHARLRLISDRLQSHVMSFTHFSIYLGFQNENFKLLLHKMDSLNDFFYENKLLKISLKSFNAIKWSSQFITWSSTKKIKLIYDFFLLFPPTSPINKSHRMVK